MARLLLAALALICCLGLSAAAGRSLLLSDQELQAQIQGLDQAAGTVFSQVSDAVATSGVVPPTSNSYSSDLQQKTIDAINKHAPLWKSDTGYFIRPQVTFLQVSHVSFDNLCEICLHTVDHPLLASVCLRCMHPGIEALNVPD